MILIYTNCHGEWQPKLKTNNDLTSQRPRIWQMWSSLNHICRSISIKNRHVEFWQRTHCQQSIISLELANAGPHQNTLLNCVATFHWNQFPSRSAFPWRCDLERCIENGHIECRQFAVNIYFWKAFRRESKKKRTTKWISRRIDS